MDNPIVDFVVLSLNRVDSTIETVESIINQKDIVSNIVIVDQASIKNQLCRLENYVSKIPNIRLIKLENNIGVAKGRNIGIRAGNNNFIIELDNDAVFSSEFAVKDSISLFINDPYLGAQGFQIDNYYTKSIDQNFWIYPKSLLTNNNPEPFYATRFPGGGHAIRRKAWEVTRGFDAELFFYWEELDLSYQMINKGYKIRFSPEIKVLHKSEPSQRVNWKDKRYYYLVRNSLYLQYKYFGLSSNLFLYMIGYFLRGARNNVMAQYFTGVQDSIKMIRNLSNKKSYRMTPEGKKYIYENDLKYRGNIFNRFFKETFVKLK